MGKEARLLALASLGEMCTLTANARDLSTATLLRSINAVTLLVSLSANESGAIQELACSSLANLLCVHKGQQPAPTQSAETTSGEKRFIGVSYKDDLTPREEGDRARNELAEAPR